MADLHGDSLSWDSAGERLWADRAPRAALSHRHVVVQPQAARARARAHWRGSLSGRSAPFVIVIWRFARIAKRTRSPMTSVLVRIAAGGAAVAVAAAMQQADGFRHRSHGSKSCGIPG